jgi:hypothetical protein
LITSQRYTGCKLSGQPKKGDLQPGNYSELTHGQKLRALAVCRRFDLPQVTPTQEESLQFDFVSLTRAALS